MSFVLPLARTIVLTDTGTAAFSARLAVYDGTPIGTPTPAPAPTPSPTIAFDAATASIVEGNGGPRTIASTITLVRDGLTGDRVVNLAYGGSATGGGDYVAGPASVTVPAGQSTASLVFTITGDATVEPDETIVVTATLAGYGAVTATKTITIGTDDAAPVFTRPPSISTDGSPTVGEVVSLDFGEISGDTIGTRQIRDAANNVVATVTTGSYRLAATGQIRLRVYAAADAGVYAESPPVTVTAPVTGPITPLRLYFDADRVAGTNPPEVYFDAPDDTVLATDILVGEVTNNGTVTSLPVQLSIEQLSTHDFLFTAFDNLAAGRFEMVARIRREKDADGNAVNPPLLSAPSNRLVDTLVAKAPPPAVEEWNASNRSALTTLYKTSDGLDRIMQASDWNNDENEIGNAVMSVGSRARPSFFEYIVEDRGVRKNDFEPSWVFMGIVDPAGMVPLRGSFPARFYGAGWDYMGYDTAYPAGQRLVTGSRVVIAVTPYVPAVNGQPAVMGTLRLWHNGVEMQPGEKRWTSFVDRVKTPVAAVQHTLASFSIYGGGQRDPRLRLNTGQEAFSVSPAGYTAWR